MAKKSADINPEKLDAQDTAKTDDSKINHINNLINNVDEDEEFLVESESQDYAPRKADEELIAGGISADKEIPKVPEKEKKPVALNKKENLVMESKKEKSDLEIKKEKPTQEIKKQNPIRSVQEKKQITEKPKPVIIKKPIKIEKHHIKPVEHKKMIPEKSHKSEKHDFNRSIKPQQKQASRNNRIIIKKQDMRSKMAKQKHDNKKGTEKSKKSLTWLWVSLAVIVVIVVAVLLFKTSYVKPVTNQTVNEIAATVNGEPIYAADINSQYDKLNPVLQKAYTKESILNQTINELLLVQESNNRNIKVTTQEVDTELQNFKDQNNLDDTKLQALLVQQNLTMDQLRNLVEKRLKVRDLLNATILSSINIAQSDIQKYYDDNIKQFEQPEKVTVSHILILVNENVTDQAAKAKIDMINQKLNSTNFCDLVTQYTEDAGSKDTCGTYTFGIGEMVPEFENASFALGINETTTVKTIYGWHLIKKLAVIPANTTSIDQVASQINQTLYDTQAQKNFDAFLATLRDKAVIVNYLIKDSTQANTASQTQNTPIINNTPATINAAANTTENQSAQTTDNAQQNTNVQNTTATSAPTVNLDDFAKCLTDKGAKLYGAYWCPHCNNQKTIFGDSVKYVTYVECADATNEQIQTPVCEQAGIDGYPTWIINDQKYPGEQTLEKLAQLTGCKLPQ